MRILILTPRLPWPPIDGGRIAMSRLAEGLQRAGAEVEVLSLNPRKQTADSTAAPIPAQAIDIDTSRFLQPAFRAMFGGIPFMAARFQSRAFRRALKMTLSRFRPDVVQIESPFLLPYAEVIRKASNARVTLRSLNVEFRIWEGLAQTERNFIRRYAAKRLAASVRNLEARHLNTPDTLVPISAADASSFRDLGCTRPIHVAPCGISITGGAPSAGQPNRVGFIGSLDFRPNQEAVRWILEELWPRVLTRFPSAQLSIAGSSPPHWVAQHPSARGIDFRGHVDDAAVFMQTMTVIIAPVFAGGGMRIKTLEGMASGKPVVATRLGAGGIEIEDGRDIIIAENADSFADAVVRLLRDPERAARIGETARATVAQRYDNDTIARGLLRFYESIL